MQYTESHEWVKITGDKALVGVTHFAQKELGDIVYVELPDVGSSFTKGEEAVVLESTKAAADVYSPLSGSVTKVNDSLNDTPELVNQDPEEKGWLFEMQLSDTGEVEGLMDLNTYKAQLESN